MADLLETAYNLKVAKEMFCAVETAFETMLIAEYGRCDIDVRYSKTEDKNPLLLEMRRTYQAAVRAFNQAHVDRDHAYRNVMPSLKA